MLRSPRPGPAAGGRQPAFDMDKKRVWCVRGGAMGEADAIFLRHGQAAIASTDALADAGALPPARSAFKAALEQAGAAPAAAIPAVAGQLFRFVHEVRIGDRILYPRKADRTLHWGEIVGPYVYDPEHGADFAHRRGVRWLARRSRDDFPAGALYEIGAALTLFEVKDFADEFVRIFAAGAEAPAEPSPESDDLETPLHDVEEATRDYIAKRLRRDFKGYAMEPLVADLFRAMGYRARATRGVRDDGVDVVAHRDELGVEPPILKIQVKARYANIGVDSVKAFFAGVHDREVGIFITTGAYTAGALDFARVKSNLRLIDGAELVDLIQRHYDALGADFRRRIPLRRVLVPAGDGF